MSILLILHWSPISVSNISLQAIVCRWWRILRNWAAKVLFSIVLSIWVHSNYWEYSLHEIRARPCFWAPHDGGPHAWSKVHRYGILSSSGGSQYGDSELHFFLNWCSVKSSLGSQNQLWHPNWTLSMTLLAKIGYLDDLAEMQWTHKLERIIHYITISDQWS